MSCSRSHSSLGTKHLGSWALPKNTENSWTPQRITVPWLPVRSSFLQCEPALFQPPMRTSTYHEFVKMYRIFYLLGTFFPIFPAPRCCSLACSVGNGSVHASYAVGLEAHVRKHRNRRLSFQLPVGPGPLGTGPRAPPSRGCHFLTVGWRRVKR